MKYDNLRKKLYLLFLILIVLGVLLTLGYVLYTFYTVGDFRDDIHKTEAGKNTLSELTDGWTLTDSDGQTMPVTLPMVYEGTSSVLTLTHELPAFDYDDPVILFDNGRNSMVIGTDLGDLYKVNMSPMARSIRYTAYEIVYMPSSGASEIVVTINTDRMLPCQIPTIYFGRSVSANYFILSMDWLTLLLLVLLFVTGLAVIILSFVMYLRNHDDGRPRSLLFFLLFSWIWGFTDSYLPALTRAIPQEVIGFLCYVSLMSVPIPILMFVWRSLKKENRDLFIPCLILVNTAVVIVCSLLSLTGSLYMQSTIPISYILIATAVGLGLYDSYKDFRAVKNDPESILSFSGSVILALSALLSMAAYLTEIISSYRNILLIGILLFIIMLTSSIMLRFLKATKEQADKITEMHMYEHFSLYDDLTGILNRRAFERKLAEIEAQAPGNCVLFMFDVNGLKITNDTYGHAAGDDLIVSAAKAIEYAVSGYGTCYRIGGDEFAAVIGCPPEVSVLIENRLDDICEEMNENSIWKLSIARGLSYLCHTNGQRLSISDWKQEADVAMYKNKVTMTSRRRGNRERDLQTIIDCIVSTLEARDVYTASHSARVNELSLFLADALGVSHATRDNISIAAHLHDIGKIGIPDQVLLKEGKLSDEEFALIRQHPIIGADIISKAQGMYDISRIVLYHHERYDGKGYPTGISGDDIPFEARLIAIADSIDAMTSRRCYRAPFTIDQCKEELRKASGTMYDPAITKIALENWTGIESIVLLHPKRLLNEQ